MKNDVELKALDELELREDELEMVSGGYRFRYFSPGGDINTYVNNVVQVNIAVGNGNFQANGADIRNG